MSDLSNITVKFNKILQKYTDLASIEIQANDYNDVLSFCKNQFPKLNKIITQQLKGSSHQDILILTKDRIIRTEEFFMPINYKELTLVPVFWGSLTEQEARLLERNDIAKEALLRAGGIGGVFFGLGRITSDSLEFSGLERRIRDSSLYGKFETLLDIDSRFNTRAFEGLAFTRDSNSVVPLHYGMTRVSGQILNAYIKNLQRGEQDNIRVDDTMN